MNFEGTNTSLSSAAVRVSLGRPRFWCRRPNNPSLGAACDEQVAPLRLSAEPDAKQATLPPAISAPPGRQCRNVQNPNCAPASPKLDAKAVAQLCHQHSRHSIRTLATRTAPRLTASDRMRSVSFIATRTIRKQALIRSVSITTIGP
jgi:hypothetical protein